MILKIKLTFIAAFFIATGSSFGQIKGGFNPTEAKEMIALCNSYTFLDLYNSDVQIIPAGWKKIYTSGVFGMDNKYQIFRKGDLAVLNFRGSTEKSISWMENIYSAMIPAKGQMVLQGDTFNYRFSDEPKAAVHAGYALGIGYLSKDIIHQIAYLNSQNVFNIILTGHSQGGSLVHLLRSYLESMKGTEISEKNKFKTYAFANPMVGNEDFVTDYNRSFCSDSTSFSIVNPQDLVTNMPLSYDNSSPENIINTLITGGETDIKQMAIGLFLQRYENELGGFIQNISTKLNKQISDELGEVKMPQYVDDIKYVPMQTRIELDAFDYPKALRDSSILKNDSLMQVYKRDSQGNFLNEEVYKQQPKFFQHKPYNYYAGILRKYFPAEYKVMKRKYLKENL